MSGQVSAKARFSVYGICQCTHLFSVDIFRGQEAMTPKLFPACLYPGLVWECVICCPPPLCVSHASFWDLSSSWRLLDSGNPSWCLGGQVHSFFSHLSDDAETNPASASQGEAWSSWTRRKQTPLFSSFVTESQHFPQEGRQLDQLITHTPSLSFLPYMKSWKIIYLSYSKLSDLISFKPGFYFFVRNNYCYFGDLETGSHSATWLTLNFWQFKVNLLQLLSASITV